MALRELQLSDLQLAACTRWVSPAGVIYLELHRVISFITRLTANQAPVLDVELGTDADYTFVCKAVEFTGVTPGTLVQIQWPDGRYLSNPGLDFFSFVGTGKRARLIDPHKVMRAQSKIRMNFDNSAVDAVSDVELYFSGVVRVPLVNA